MALVLLGVVTAACRSQTPTYVNPVLLSREAPVTSSNAKNVNIDHRISGTTAGGQTRPLGELKERKGRHPLITRDGDCVSTPSLGLRYGSGT
jgi:hypothetical protein